MKKYRIKEWYNKKTGDVKYELQRKILFWWFDYDPPLIYDTYEECRKVQYKMEAEDAWKSFKK